MKEQLKKEILETRKQKLNLNVVSTEEVFNKIIHAYKNLLFDADRNVFDYTIDITLCDLSGFNRLGDIEHLYQKWGDYYFVDLNNSAFVPDVVNEEGQLESEESIYFSKVEILKDVRDIQISLKEWINLCQKENIELKIYAKDDYNHNTVIEININGIFNEENQQVKSYLDSISK